MFVYVGRITKVPRLIAELDLMTELKIWALDNVPLRPAPLSLHQQLLAELQKLGLQGSVCIKSLLIPSGLLVRVSGNASTVLHQC